MILENLLQNISLKEYTTIKLGGFAKYFAECNSEEEIKDALIYSQQNKLKTFILGGGSNVVFSDNGFNGLVIKINLKGLQIHSETKDRIILKVSAGENWDNFVKYCVNNNLAGLECLSGIPGSVGASPMQNIGAYGQEVKNTIIYVKTLDRETFKPVVFTNEDCDFGYRQSRFKNQDKDRYIITEVMFRLVRGGEPEIKYPELIKSIYEDIKPEDTINGKPGLSKVRETVLNLRRKKSMVVDENDPDSVSCGSFFLNPVISEDDFKELLNKIPHTETQIPNYPTEEGIKLSSAFLIEQSGFVKGFTKNGIGISSKHSLAIINMGGTTKALIELTEEIKSAVYQKFGISLVPEPEIVAG